MTGAIASFSSGKELTGSSQQCPGIWYLDNELICEFRAWDQLLVGVWLADGETPESAIFLLSGTSRSFLLFYDLPLP